MALRDDKVMVLNDFFYVWPIDKHHIEKMGFYSETKKATNISYTGNSGVLNKNKATLFVEKLKNS